MPVDAGPARARYGDFVAEQLTAAGGGEWHVSRRGVWTYATPDVAQRDQGWKLHVSATLASAHEVLRRAVPVLIEAQAPFKVASTAADLATLNSTHCPRPSSGKFITVYPLDDDQAIALMASLDQATTGLPGPAILSDRQYRQGGVVHYRYGAFRGRAYISNDGDLVHAIIGPDGELVEDRRTAHFDPPDWVEPPLPDPRGNPGRKPAEVLLGGRFVVRQAVRYANKGGVFQATDRQTGEEVVVKQARAHVGGDERGLDARHLLANEAHVLEVLQPTGVTPRLIAFFEQGGDSFLAEEAVPGETLRTWNGARWKDEVPSLGETLPVARKVADVLTAVHHRAVIVRDFTPNNLIVQPNADVRLVDLELAVTVSGLDEYSANSDPGYRRLTPAYGSAEQAAGLPPGFGDDGFALGAMLCFLFTGEDPHIDPDSPLARASHPVAAWLGSGPRGSLVPSGIRHLVLALTAPDATRRLSSAAAGVALRQLEERLSKPRPSRRQLHEAALTDLRPLEDRTCEGAVRDALAAIRSSARTGSERYWPATEFGMTTDPRNIQHGVAGVIGALVQYWRCTGDQSILDLVHDATTWLAARLGTIPFAPVGVHFGAAGPAWSLCDAGCALGDDRLVEMAAELALRLPTEWPSPDVTHGRAGLGLALLHLYRVTGDTRLLAAAGRCADSLLDNVEHISKTVIGWRTPAGFRSTFAGGSFYGFAHGTAGIATFLLNMATVTGRDELHQVTSTAAASLVESSARRDELVGWGEGPDGPPAFLPHWCNGASGVGSFLVRWWKVSQDESLIPVIDGAARTVMATKWRSGVAYCHGLAGNADFLLDAAEILEDDRYRLWAADLASVIYDRRVVQDGLCTFGDQTGRRTPDFNVGLSGVLSFFLRLRHGGPRLWMVDF